MKGRTVGLDIFNGELKMTETIFLEFDAITKNEDTFNWVYQLIDEYIQEVKDRGGNVKIASEKTYEFDSVTLMIQEDNAINHFKEREGKKLITLPLGDNGRQQTLSMSITLYPEAPEDFKLEPKELSCLFIDTQLGRDQKVARYTTYAQITHKPTGIIVTSTDERNQVTNKEMAERLLKAKLFKLK